MRRNALQPIVIENCTTRDFIHYLMHQHTVPTNLIICSTREAFLQELLHETDPTAASTSGHEDEANEMCSDVPPARPSDLPPSLSSLLRPTPSLLATSSTIKLSFCPDLTHLLAYLSLLIHRKPDASSPDDLSESASRGGHGRPILAILNPIRLHKPTSSFSAQGFNRTFASAVETAHHRGQQLLLVEANEYESLSPEEAEARQHRHLEPDNDGEYQPVQQSEDPWAQQLSMLNVTTKTFGVGERGWVGRTVSVRQVAERWCEFTTLSEVVEAERNHKSGFEEYLR